MADLLDDLLDFHAETHVDKTDRQTIIRAPFGIPGTKTRSIQYLRQYLPVRKKWIDHFCGSGIVTFNRPKSELEVMNDRFGGIVAFYRCLKDKTKKASLIELTEANCHSREEFYFNRDTWKKETDDVVRAAKWFYMIRCSVIGKGAAFARQTNSKPQFPLHSSLKLFEGIHERLQSVIVENLDFETCHKDFDSDDAIHYFDPPYIGTDPGVYEHKWTRDDVSRLLRVCHESKGFVAVSGYPDAQFDDEKFWTARYTWEVPVGAEVKAFLAENFKMKLKNVQEQDYVTEVLWVKER